MNALKKFHILIVLCLLVSVVSPAWAVSATPVSGPARIQPILRTIASQSPEKMVSVIVQKSSQDAGLEARVAQLGGKVTADLSIIDAVAVELPAAAAVTLAMQPQVRWVSLDAEMQSTACSACIDTTNLLNAYDGAIRADKVWNKYPYNQGKGIGVAIVDSGVNPNGDLYTVMGVNRLVANVRFNSDYNQNPSDGYGHGTHVSSIVGGDGSESNGKYIGIAPMANIINVKVSNDDGSARMMDVVAGLQWVLENKTNYNIRVVNLSMNSSVAESYNTSPLDAAVEVLWFNGIVVVVSAGNNGTSTLFPPANDPFVITVGATDDVGTVVIADDSIASFSAYGKTENNQVKPDLVAPGRNIVARLVNTNMGLALEHPANLVDGQYFRMSGTSMAAPMVSGTVALLLNDEPKLTPDQVKYRLKKTANKSWPGYNVLKAGAGYVDAYAAVYGTTTESANTGFIPSRLLTTGPNPITFGNVGWNSVGWNSVGWNSVGWNSVGWNSVGWNSDYWDD